MMQDTSNRVGMVINPALMPYIDINSDAKYVVRPPSELAT